MIGTEIIFDLDNEREVEHSSVLMSSEGKGKERINLEGDFFCRFRVVYIRSLAILCPLILETPLMGRGVDTQTTIAYNAGDGTVPLPLLFPWR